MSETLGSLCDKLTIVKLKQFHSEDQRRLQSLGYQEEQLQDEINDFFVAAMIGKISFEKLIFSANKIFKKEGNIAPEARGNIGEVFAQLAEVNCKLWHEQEKVYDFDKVPADEKNTIVKHLALFNLERTKCIDDINKQFQEFVKQNYNNM
jgi:hypothetical protein